MKIISEFLNIYDSAVGNDDDESSSEGHSPQPTQTPSPRDNETTTFRSVLKSTPSQPLKHPSTPQHIHDNNIESPRFTDPKARARAVSDFEPMSPELVQKFFKESHRAGSKSPFNVAKWMSQP